MDRRTFLFESSSVSLAEFALCKSTVNNAGGGGSVVPTTMLKSMIGSLPIKVASVLSTTLALLMFGINSSAVYHQIGVADSQV